MHGLRPSTKPRAKTTVSRVTQKPNSLLFRLAPLPFQNTLPFQPSSSLPPLSVDPFELMMSSSARHGPSGAQGGSGEHACCAFCERSVVTDDLSQCDSCQDVFCRNCRVTNYDARHERTFCLDCHVDATRPTATPTHALTSPIPAGFGHALPSAHVHAAAAPSPYSYPTASSPYTPYGAVSGTPGPYSAAGRPYSQQAHVAVGTPTASAYYAGSYGVAYGAAGPSQGQGLCQTPTALFGSCPAPGVGTPGAGQATPCHGPAAAGQAYIAGMGGASRGAGHQGQAADPLGVWGS